MATGSRTNLHTFPGALLIRFIHEASVVMADSGKHVLIPNSRWCIAEGSRILLIHARLSRLANDLHE